MSSFFLILKVAVGALLLNKVRGALTSLGIIIGVAAVIAVLSIGKGARSLMRVRLATLGNNYMVVLPDQHRQGAVSSGSGKGETLTTDDGEAIARMLPHLIAGMTPVINMRHQLVVNNRNWNATVRGVGVDFPFVRNQGIAAGRFFELDEQRYARRVCAIGVTVRDQLYGPGVNPVGRTVRIANMPFKVVGLLTPRGANTMGEDQDDAVLLPYTTATRVLSRSTFNAVSTIQLSLRASEYLDKAHEEITALLRQRHRLSDWRDNDFEIRDTRELIQTVETILSLVTVLLTVAAAISLLVGGIGIMNIMLVSVIERIREIGLRFAIGATPAQVLGQFVLESVVLAGVGGLVGVFFGAGVSVAAGLVLGWSDCMPSVFPIALGFGFALVVGVFFGFYPAWRASKLNPMQCLRYE